MRSLIVVFVGVVAVVTMGAILGDVGVGQERNPPAPPPGEVAVLSPMGGLFTLAEMSGGSPSVKVGDRVRVGTVLGIVDNMPVRSMVSGTVMDIMVEDGQMVVTGQPLFRIKTP